MATLLLSPTSRLAQLVERSGSRLSWARILPAPGTRAARHRAKVTNDDFFITQVFPLLRLLEPFFVCCSLQLGFHPYRRKIGFGLQETFRNFPGGTGRTVSLL